ncbi:MAG TPA: VOC family protein [Anaerolineales bacterium]
MLGDAPVYAVLPCVDLEGARKFYGEVLGLKQVDLPGASEEEAAGNALFQCGEGTRLLIYQRPTPTRADHTAAGWLVEDVEAVVDALMAHGVRMEVYDMPDVEFDEKGIARFGNRSGAWFKDPEGNILAINQMP